MSDPFVSDDDMDVHTWFELSYSSYLAVNRSLLQSMPNKWQYRFVACMRELQHHFRNIEEPRYTVHARDDQGRFIRDPIPHYNRGRTFVPGASDCDGYVAQGPGGPCAACFRPGSEHVRTWPS